MTTVPDADVVERRRTARVLATAEFAELERLWAEWPETPEVEHLRGPESGLVMVQGRSGGTGDRFNLGEATVTRATVIVRPAGSTEVAGTEVASDETVGTAYVLGSHPEHATIAACFEALLAGEARERVLADVIAPLEQAQGERDARARAEARSTVVDFFTVARENGPDEEDEE